MNKTHISIFIIIIILAAVFFSLKGRTLEAPTPQNNTQNNEVPADSEPITNNGSGNRQNIGCTQEAKICPDGSAVGRTGPNCEFAACPGEKQNQAAKEFVVSGNNFSFNPSVIKVNKGDKVRVVFKNTAGFHDFKIDAYGVATKKTNAPTEEVLEFTADKTGSFEYYCSVGTHRAQGMKGTLVVE